MNIHTYIIPCLNTRIMGILHFNLMLRFHAHSKTHLMQRLLCQRRIELTNHTLIAELGQLFWLSSKSIETVPLIDEFYYVYNQICLSKMR